ncbi:hypothetical protein EVAR_42402_1 [Eumeta japonica]|uniref:Uncharacterized protein n=1 Tax=Eumeta variegata TaxID=151549 RepID=A0A4C1XB33_EUMVA|nr:hypothetical protein EVAR_42402_1 [Eumeta japonica]
MVAVTSHARAQSPARAQGRPRRFPHVGAGRAGERARAEEPDGSPSWPTYRATFDRTFVRARLFARPASDARRRRDARPSSHSLGLWVLRFPRGAGACAHSDRQTRESVNYYRRSRGYFLQAVRCVNLFKFNFKSINFGYDTVLDSDPESTLAYDHSPVLNRGPSAGSQFCSPYRFEFQYRSRFQFIRSRNKCKVWILLQTILYPNCRVKRYETSASPQCWFGRPPAATVPSRLRFQHLLASHLARRQATRQVYERSMA